MINPDIGVMQEVVRRYMRGRLKRGVSSYICWGVGIELTHDVWVSSSFFFYADPDLFLRLEEFVEKHDD